MGNQANIGHGKYPRQGAWLGRRARVCFNYDMRNVLGGVIVRDDTEDPYRTIIHLDDGRFLLASECQFNLPEGAAVPAAPLAGEAEEPCVFSRYSRVDPNDEREWCSVHEEFYPCIKPEPAPEPTPDHEFVMGWTDFVAIAPDPRNHCVSCGQTRDRHAAPSPATPEPTLIDTHWFEACFHDLGMCTRYRDPYDRCHVRGCGEGRDRHKAPSAAKETR